MKNASVVISGDLHRIVRVKAAIKEMSIKEFVENVLKKEVSKDTEKK